MLPRGSPAWAVCRLSTQRAIVLGILATFFKAFDVPVFWPILVLYFIILFVISMKKQIAVRFLRILWPGIPSHPHPPPFPSSRIFTDLGSPPQHMIKYRYIPISFGKPKHRGKEVHTCPWPWPPVPRPLLRRRPFPFALTNASSKLACGQDSGKVIRQ